jgi:hypothetical protein
MAIFSWSPYVTRILSEECTPSKLAVSSPKMAIRLPPAVMFKTSATSSIKFTTVRIGKGTVKDFKQKAITLTRGSLF